MPQGWSRVTNNEFVKQWVPSKDLRKPDVTVVVRVFGFKDEEQRKFFSGKHMWNVDIFGKKVSEIRGFKTKPEAMKWAMRWMKKHPKGKV